MRQKIYIINVSLSKRINYPNMNARGVLLFVRDYPSFFLCVSAYLFTPLLFDTNIF